MAALAAQNSFRTSLALWPDQSWVIGFRCMAFKAWKPITAALKFDRNDVEYTFIVETPSLRVNVHALYLFTMDKQHYSRP